MSNAALLTRAITQDGTLLKPSKPVTAVDSEIASLAPSTSSSPVDSLDAQSNAQTKRKGHVYSTFSGEAM
jgi:hypothetical protein